MSNQYSVYALSDPRDHAVHYVGMSKNPEQRLKQHVRNAPKWVQGLLEQGVKPVLQVLESVPDLKTAQEREKHWIHHFEGKGFALENLVHNEAAHREREERECLYRNVYASFIKNNPPQDAHKLTKMTIAGYDTVGMCAWDTNYEAAWATICLLRKRPGFGLQVSEFDAIEITFNIFGYTWKDGSEA